MMKIKKKLLTMFFICGRIRKRLRNKVNYKGE